MSDAESKAFLERIRVAASNIKEHCDAVHILASVVDDEGRTTIYSHGNGNHYARQGMAREFVEKDQARTYWDEKPTEPPDESDEWKSQPPKP